MEQGCALTPVENLITPSNRLHRVKMRPAAEDAAIFTQYPECTSVTL